jgi:choline dehydrogenase-like flavoprotein
MILSDLSKAAYHQDVTASFCVVGGGIAGLLLATRLAKAGKSVVVLESGGAIFDADVHELNRIEDPGGRYTRALDGRYRGLGGSSSRWGGRMVPMSPQDTLPRPHINDPGWPLAAAQLDRYDQEIEDLFDIGHGSFQEIGRGAAPSGIISDEQSFIARWARCPSFARCNIVTALGSRLKAVPNLTIWLNATVTEFDIDRETGRLRGVTARDLGFRTLKARADEFVLAAGSIESTRLLLELDEAGDGRVFAGCDALGRYFQDHLKAEVASIDRTDAALTNRLFGYHFVKSTRRDLHLELSASAQQEQAIGSGFVYVAMDVKNQPLNALKAVARGLQRRQVPLRQLGQLTKDAGFVAQALYWRLGRRQLFVPAGVDLRLLVCAEQLPRRENRVQLGTQRDALGMRRARFEWAPGPADERSLRALTGRLARYWQAAGFDAICPLRWTRAASDPAVPIIEDAQACAHPSGSTRMGTDPGTSVVAPDLRCHAIRNVAVASASVFPTAGSANPTFTIMKLALWLADSYLGATTVAAPVAEVVQRLGLGV